MTILVHPLPQPGHLPVQAVEVAAEVEAEEVAVDLLDDKVDRSPMLVTLLPLRVQVAAGVEYAVPIPTKC